MRRVTISPREHWRKIVEAQGLVFHTTKGAAYWDESAYYEFSRNDADVLERASNELHRLCMLAVAHVIEKKRYADLKIPEAAVPLIEASWHARVPSVYGRFDLAFNGYEPPKMLEYNADTPTSLIEAAVVQWFWLQDLFPEHDQLNSLHERLIAHWKMISLRYPNRIFHFSSLGEVEDLMTVTYLRDTATQAGMNTRQLFIRDLGWDEARACFVGLDRAPITHVFKLYPWEWLLSEPFASHLFDARANVAWFEPAWKMILQSKAILPILWELFEGHPNLLPAYADGPRDMIEYARKPVLSREGANVTLVTNERIVETGGEYGAEGFVYQALAPRADFGDQHVVLGSWIIGDESAGIGVRESASAIITNTSRFLPHVIEG